MSDELTALQETATQARAQADQLKAALTDASSDEETAAATAAKQAATDAESALAEAQAKAEADAAAAQGGAGAKKEDGAAPDAELSRTGYAAKGLHAGDECICPDGRKGTVHSFDAGLICIPNHDQG